MISLLYLVLAALGLGFLIFIHELGHYWMARKEGMTVEVFSIGFGKPLYTWEHQGVKWQFCWLPFGGYVRIAGMEKKGALEPYQIPDGFYGKKPWARIKVASIGPLVNLLFALFVFSLLWLAGGRLKAFSEYTHLIGWVDPSSPLFRADVRPGDEIQQLNQRPFRQFQDLLYAALLDDRLPCIAGLEIDYFSGQKRPFSFQFPMSKEGGVSERISSVLSTIAPASYLLYQRPLEVRQNPSGLEASPMQASGIQGGDRIIWVDGELVFSKEQLVAIVNQAKVLLTVQRKDRSFLFRVPRIKISDLRIQALQRAEWEDWQHAAQVKGKLQDLFFIPYDVSPRCMVEQPLTYLNEETLEQQPVEAVRSPLDTPLMPGDKIIAVDGIPVTSGGELLQCLQTRAIQMIVKREGQMPPPISWKEADAAFAADIPWKDLEQMIQCIGTQNPIYEIGNLKRLNPVVPLPRSKYPFPLELKEKISKDFEEQRQTLEQIKEPEQRAQAIHALEEANNRLLLGIVPVDRKVVYNPSPFVLFAQVSQETWRTLIALFAGHVSPKYMQGPVGIVQVMHQSWMLGVKEALFWLGMISLNLGMLNLLPVPVLDGGHICFSLWEWITKKPIKAKTMERLIIPFIALLIGFFLYLTYHDLARLFSRFF